MIEPVMGRGVVNIQDLIDDANCATGKYANCVVPRGYGARFAVTSTASSTASIPPKSSACRRYFDDLTGTIFEGHHQPLRVWILCLYFMGLNLSHSQIARELDLNKDDVQAMALQLRDGIVEHKPAARLEGIVECDEVYIVAGHKGQPYGGVLALAALLASATPGDFPGALTLSIWAFSSSSTTPKTAAAATLAVWSP